MTRGDAENTFPPLALPCNCTRLFLPHLIDDLSQYERLFRPYTALFICIPSTFPLVSGCSSIPWRPRGSGHCQA